MSYDEDYSDRIFASEESAPLTRSTTPGTIKYSASYVYRNFLVMAVAFSLGHGVMTTCLAYAAAELGSSLGGISSGILYVLYSFTTLLVSKPFVTMTGPKLALIAALIALCVYACGFCLSIIFEVIAVDVAWLFACATATVGGLGSGLLWTCQGRMFAQNAKLYAESSRSPVERCNASFGAVFAAVFLGIEMLLKVGATVTYLVFPSLGAYVIFISYAGVALLAVMLAMSLDDLADEGTGVFNYPTISKEAGAVAKMTWVDKRLALMVPFQISFGFLMAFVNLYIFGTVVSTDEDWGTVYIGLSSAMVTLVGAALAMPANWASNSVGSETIVLAGAACITLSGAFLYVISNDALATVGMMVPYLILVGIGRLSWENTNKVIVADWWVMDPNESTNAFTATSFFSGYASAMGYFIFPFATRIGMITTITLTGLFGAVCYFAAFRVHVAMVTDVPTEEKRALAHRQFWERRNSSRILRVTVHRPDESSGAADIAASLGADRRVAASGGGVAGNNRPLV